MPAKKAAKKAAKKSAKKTHGQHRTNDLRRAYEHLGRIEVLEPTLTRAARTDVSTLAELAALQLQSGEADDAADLLRAAEHLSFADLTTESSRPARISEELHTAINEEFDHLVLRAEHHWEKDTPRSGAIAGIYTASVKLARRAHDEGRYREALELARAAEALAHVKDGQLRKLPNPAQRHKLAS